MKKIMLLIVMLVANVSMMFAQNQHLTVEQVFSKASQIEGFQKVKYMEDDMKFPKNIGKPTMIVHGNAEPREAVLALLAQLPDNSLIYDDTDERGRFDRLFLDENTNNLLYVHIGINGNDSVLILFKGGKRENINKFIEKIKNE